VPFRVLGAGSNILVADAGVPGITARLRGTLAAWSFSSAALTAGAGAMSGALVQAAIGQELAGLECLAGVPGTLGGALAGNAGTTAAIGDLVESVDVLSADGEIIRLGRADCAFAYRSSALAGRVIVRSTLCLKKGQKNDIVSAVHNAILRRSQTQPRGTWNAGSVFKNPPGDHAGRLIDACGLKGATAGGAQISDQHANFIINTGTATAADIDVLIARARDLVRERFGVTLELEVKRWA
jgi:UDP-N-acetylmuramate dehydrogenase